MDKDILHQELLDMVIQTLIKILLILHQEAIQHHLWDTASLQPPATELLPHRFLNNQFQE
jgi:hypothetical protein